MAQNLNLQIITPEKIIFSETINQVSLPTPKGEVTILPDHIPLITSLSPGEITIVQGDKETFLAVSGGLVQIDLNQIKILADTAEKAQEIDIKRAQEAHQRAVELMNKAKQDQVDFTALTVKMEKELARLKVARRRKHTNQPTIQSD